MKKIENIDGHRLFLEERRQVLEWDWLSDEIINASQRFLALQFPGIKGLRNTLYYDEDLRNKVKEQTNGSLTVF